MSNRNKTTAFPDCYLDDIVETHRQMFSMVREYIYDIDEVWFIENYLSSETFKKLCEGNFIYLNKTPDELLDSFMKDIKGVYKKGDKEFFGGFFFEWLGELLMFIAWYTGEPCTGLFKKLGIRKFFEVYMKFQLNEFEDVYNILVEKCNSLES